MASYGIRQRSDNRARRTRRAHRNLKPEALEQRLLLTTIADLQPTAPLGALIYQGSESGIIGAVTAEEGFESGTSGTLTTSSSEPEGRIQVTGEFGTASGDFALLMDRNPRGAQNLNEAVWTVDLSGQSDALLQFAHADFGDEERAFDGPFVGSFNADGVAVSNDGVNWFPIFDAPSQPNGEWVQYTLSLPTAIQGTGLNLDDPDFFIKFQQYDNFPLTTDGRGWDDLAVITPAPETDSFEIAVDPGQTIAVIVASDALQSAVDLVRVTDDGGVVRGSATAGGVGEEAFVQAVATRGLIGGQGPGPETYRVDVRAAEGTTSLGQYSVTVILNSSLEEEVYGGSANDTIDTAQDLELSAVQLHRAVGADSAGAQPARLAVLGRLDYNFLDTAFFEDFESDHGFTIDNAAPEGYIEGLWHLSTGRGEQLGHSANHSFYYGQGEGPEGGGTYQLFTRTPTTGTITSPPIVLPEVTGDSDVIAQFGHVLETRVNPTDVDFAELQINNGNGWTTVQRYDRVAESSTWTTAVPANLSAYAAQTVQLRWSFDTRRGPGSRGPEGWYVDDVRISEAALVDYYSFQLGAGDTATITLTGEDADMTLLAPDGGSLAEGSANLAANVDEIISNFVAPTTGTYFVRVTGEPGAEYGLVATRNADFDTENNDGAAHAQEVISKQVVGRQWVLGALSVADIPEKEPNDSIETAQNIDDENWNLNFSPNIGDAASNTSETIPHVTIKGTGDDTFDHYSFTVANAGDVAIFDIDFGSGAGGSFDSWITLFASDGTELATNDDSSPSDGQGGSVSFQDSFIEYTFDDPGVYVIQVGRFPRPLPVPDGATYELQVSLENHLLVPARDFYAVTLGSNEPLEVETSTPAGQSGEFNNPLDPAIRVYDAAGNLVASDDNSAPDGRNARLKYKVPKGGDGTYYVQISPSDATPEQTAGEYIITFKGGAGELPPFQVIASDPFDGQRARGATTQITVDFNDTILLESLDVSDLTIDGVEATGLTVVDGNTLIFDLPTLTEGNHNVRIAAGAMRDVQQTPLEDFNITFFEDVTPPRVVGSSLQEGDIITVGSVTTDLTYTAHFSEPMQTANLDPSDFSLRGTVVHNTSYEPTSYEYDATGTTLTLNYSDLPEDGYRLTLRSGNGRFEDSAEPDGFDLDGEPVAFPIPPNQSGDGDEGGDFIVNFELDIATAPFPTPLTPKLPQGSLIYDPSVIGLIQPASDTDSYIIDVDPGQTITIIVDPGPQLQPTVQLSGPLGGAPLGTATAAAAGVDAVLQTIAAVTGGTYTATVGSAAGTGAYTVQFILNAAVEEESHDGASNDTQTTAQDLDASSLDLLKTATRAAAIGTSDVDFVTGATIYLEDFESDHGFTFDNTAPEGYIEGLWHLSTGRGEQPGHSANHSFYYGQGEGPEGGGTYQLFTRTPTTGTVTSPPIALPNLTLPGQLITVSFNHVLETRGFPGDVDFASLEVDDGNGWTTVQRYDRVAESSVWTRTNPVDLSPYAGQTIQLRWVFDTRRGPGSRGPEGWYIDDVEIQHITLVPDYYSFSVREGESVTLALSGSAALGLTLEDDSGTTLAVANADQTNVDQMIYNIGPLTSGTYFARVTGELGAEVRYGLVVTRDAVFDREANDTFDTAQNFDGVVGSLGHVQSGADGGTADEDWYSVTLTVGESVFFETITPADGPGEFVNLLDPHLELYDPSGALITGVVQVKPDGRNESIDFTPSVGGLYRIRVTAENDTRGEYFLDPESIVAAAAPIQGFQLRVEATPINNLPQIAPGTARPATSTFPSAASQAHLLSVAAAAALPMGAKVVVAPATEFVTNVQTQFGHESAFASFAGNPLAGALRESEGRVRVRYGNTLLASEITAPRSVRQERPGWDVASDLRWEAVDAVFLKLMEEPQVCWSSES